VAVHHLGQLPAVTISFDLAPGFGLGWPWPASGLIPGLIMLLGIVKKNAIMTIGFAL
jgi:hypothetical protein